MTKLASVHDLSIEDRINRAKSKTQLLVDQALQLIEMHEANRIIVYSPMLSAQIPASYSAHAFNSFQRGLHHFEIVRLCAIWSFARTTDLEIVSIPAVVQLVDHPEVLSALHGEAEQSLASWRTRVYSQDEDESARLEIDRQLKLSQQLFAAAHAHKGISRLIRSIRMARGIEKSRRLKSVTNLRDKFLAHNLEQSRLDKREQVAKMKYGDERRLLFQAIATIDSLHHSVNGTGFDWKSSFQMARRNAEGLWNNCIFNVVY